MMKKTFLFIMLFAVSVSLWTLENHDWLTEFDWFIEDGRYLVDPSAKQTVWMGWRTPLAVFKKFYIPSNSILYQARLRKELFYFLYQTEEKDKLFPIGSALGTGVYDLEFENNYSNLSYRRNGLPGYQERVGQQTHPDYPLVGIWGRLPFLTEYRLVDHPADCLYYMEIDREIPGWAVRSGTYLLRQTGDKVFESISSFPDGRIKIEIKSERLLLLTPLFTLPDEDGLVAPLGMGCIPEQPRFIRQE
jgi:hypothetical protein